ncbi:ribokinase [Salinibacterium sp.]|uniref:ribokinase n=1 Tax=Salinibacterium sp. TaxID=1915057 RepID=UPI00286C1FEE|nr:ribokinase [Salinibacterium sp.]
MSETTVCPKPPKVVVVGSANVDQVFRVVSIPAPGETVMSMGTTTARGGKGQNQAVAAARAGASTTLICAVGDDEFGRLTRDGLSRDGIDTALVRTVDAPTGTALIAVDDSGENTIIVDAGANAALIGLTNADTTALRAADVLVIQLEIPLDTVSAAARIGRAGNTTVILNAAPIQDLPAGLLADVDILVVNEHEAAHLSRGSSGRLDDSDGAAGNVDALAPVVIVTQGKQGAVLHERGSNSIQVAAPRVTSADATGAGDTFCGALAAALAEGMRVETAVRFAVVAASLSVQRAGAVPSIPQRVTIDEALSTGNLGPDSA